MIQPLKRIQTEFQSPAEYFLASDRKTKNRVLQMDGGFLGIGCTPSVLKSLVSCASQRGAVSGLWMSIVKPEKSESNPVPVAVETSGCWDALKVKAKFIRDQDVKDVKPQLAIKDKSQEGKFEEALEEVRKELKGLRLEVASRSETKAPVINPTSEREVTQQVPASQSVQWQMYFTASETQEETIKRIELVESGGSIKILAYSYDRQDISAALAAAQKRGVQVQVLIDHRQTLKGPKEQLAVVQQLRSQGISVKTLSGVALGPEYHAAGRAATPTAYSGLQGIMHVKGAIIKQSPDKDVWWTLLGSTNWTTSSRCNVEWSQGLNISGDEPELKRVLDRFSELWQAATDFTEAEVRQAQRSRSASPGK